MAAREVDARLIFNVDNTRCSSPTVNYATLSSRRCYSDIWSGRLRRSLEDMAVLQRGYSYLEDEMMDIVFDFEMMMRTRFER